MNHGRNEKIVVAMSGGVDSSVAAALLVSQGYQVIGMMMRLWSEPGAEIHNRCCTPDAMSQARRVSAILGIPFYAVDAQQIFHNVVVQNFLEGYTIGITPNPCLACNRKIRWEFLLDRALSLGATYMVTGHYARVIKDQDDVFQLHRSVDLKKDQSYVLHVLKQDQLSHAQFPLGNYTKQEVRQLARDFGLPVAERADSQDLCFLGNGDYREFLVRHAPQVEDPGPITDQSGQVLGEHRGLAFYTIGQRKGLGIAAPQPLYVLGKDTNRNCLIVGTQDQLGLSQLVAGPINWISGSPPGFPLQAQVKIRYKARDALATIFPLKDLFVRIEFDEPQRDITPGQAAVIYQGELCLGGGMIQ